MSQAPTDHEKVSETKQPTSSTDSTQPATLSSDYAPYPKLDPKDVAPPPENWTTVSMASQSTLSSAKTAAEKKEAYWTQETTRLGQQVVHTRTTVEAQLKLVQGKRKEVERVQRVLQQEELELGRRRSTLSKEESELKDSETSQRIARDNLKVKDSTVNCPGTYTNYYR